MHREASKATLQTLTKSRLLPDAQDGDDSSAISINVPVHFAVSGPDISSWSAVWRVVHEPAIDCDE